MKKKNIKAASPSPPTLGPSQSRTPLATALPWLLATLLAGALVYVAQQLTGERAKTSELDKRLEFLKTEVEGLRQLQESHSQQQTVMLENFKDEALQLQSQTKDALNKTKQTIQANQNSLADNRRLFNLKSFIDDLTGAHVRVYYHEGQKIDTQAQYIDFVRAKIISYTKGADSPFIRENRYYYYDLMAALVIYGSKKTEFKPAWNPLQLDDKNKVFVAIIEAFQNELPVRESQTMMASLEEIHRNATAGEDLPLVSKK